MFCIVNSPEWLRVTVPAIVIRLAIQSDLVLRLTRRALLY
ncbi:hypothetical protein SUPREME284_87 [Citrobacter phage vB_CfrD_Supreme284]|nr:hypothetical protein SUPREME284_87 [Citrobacter phage vB_CfrD_Supreme284]